MSRQIKLGGNCFGEELYAGADSDGFWVEIWSPYGPSLGVRVSDRADLEALAELVAESLAALPDKEEQ